MIVYSSIVFKIERKFMRLPNKIDGVGLDTDAS